VYDEAVKEALIVTWEASDRMCGKRLKAILLELLEAMERHGYLRLEAEVRRRVLRASAATIDRLLKPIRCHVAIIWRPDQEEPWHLLTNQEEIRATRLGKVFAHRMSVEEYFRDTRSLRNCFALRLIQIQDSQRLSRFLLISAWAYLLLVALGLYASHYFRSGEWCSNNRPGQCSLFTIGKAMLHRILPSVTHLARRLRIELLSPNWG